MTVGEFIKNKREALGFSMYTLGEKAGISAQYVNDVEKNKKRTPPADNTLIKLAFALQLSEKEKNELLDLAALERTPGRMKKVYSEKKLMDDFIKEEVNLERLSEFIIKNSNLFLSLPNKKEHFEFFKVIESIGYKFVSEYNISNKAFSDNLELWELELINIGLRCLDGYKIYSSFKSQEQPQGNISPIEMTETTIPIYESVSAGNGGYVYGNVIETIPMPVGMGLPKDAVGFLVRGNSMEDEIPDNSKIIIRPTTEVRNGQIGVFVVNDEWYVKYYKESKSGTIFLISENEEYEDIEIEKHDRFYKVGIVELVMKKPKEKKRI